MTRNSHEDVRVDRDGVRTTRNTQTRPRSVSIGVPAVLLIAMVAALLWLGREPRREPVRGQSGASATERSAAKPASRDWSSVKQVTPRRSAARRAAAARAEPAAEVPPPEIDAREVISALVAAGETEGIAAFPLPGTSPPKSGIIVPEDYELPEGYVRHHQSTDDGKSLEPILMFSPDYEFVDQNGNPIAIPTDRVVPPELAPPGLPIEILDVPQTGGAADRQP